MSVSLHKAAYNPPPKVIRQKGSQARCPGVTGVNKAIPSSLGQGFLKGTESESSGGRARDPGRIEESGDGRVAGGCLY